MRILAALILTAVGAVAQTNVATPHALFLQKINADATSQSAYFINATTNNAVLFYNPTNNLAYMVPLGGGVTFTGSSLSVNTSQVTENIVVSSTNVTLTGTSDPHQIFTGNTGTYTLPNVAGSAGKVFFIKNKGSGNLLVTSFSGSQVYVTGTTDGVIMAPGDARIFVNDSQTFTVE